MKRWAVVPVKPFSAAKSRLAPALSARERQALARRLLEHTLKVLRAARGIDGVLVVTKDRAAAALARALGAEAVGEAPCDGLNRALARATREAVRRGAQAVLILPADLPLVSPRDLERVLRIPRRPPFVVIGPDRAERGTNLLYLAPPGAIAFSFGERSFARHARSALRAGARVTVCRIPAFAFDVDEPDDLAGIVDAIWEEK